MPRIATLPPGTRPWRMANSACTAIERGADRQVGKVGEGLARALRVDRRRRAAARRSGISARPRRCAAGPALLRSPSDVSMKAASRAPKDRRGPAAQTSSAGSSSPSNTCGRRVMIAASRGAAPMIVASSLSSARIGLQQREELDALPAGPPGIRRSASAPCRPSRLAEGLQQRRRQLGQPLARLGRARRPVAAEMPAADDAADVARPLGSRAATASSAYPGRRRRR